MAEAVEVITIDSDTDEEDLIPQISQVAKPAANVLPTKAASLPQPGKLF